MNMKEIAQLAGVTAATGVQSQSFCQKSQDKGEQYDWNHGRRYYSFSDTTNY